MYIYISIYIHRYIYIFMYTYNYICVYIYVCIYVFIHMSTNINIRGVITSRLSPALVKNRGLGLVCGWMADTSFGVLKIRII